MFEPQIMCFLCKWCTSSAADLAGTSRLHYAPNNINLNYNSGVLATQGSGWVYGVTNEKFGRRVLEMTLKYNF